jgi:hypothetical protein
MSKSKIHIKDLKASAQKSRPAHRYTAPPLTPADLFRRAQRVAPAMIESFGVFNVQDEAMSFDHPHDAVADGWDYTTPSWDIMLALRDGDNPVASEMGADLEVAMLDMLKAERNISYMLGLAVGLQLAKGQIGGVR